MLLEIPSITCVVSKDAAGRTLFFPVPFVFVDDRRGLVIGHEGNLQVRSRVFRFRIAHPPSSTTLDLRAFLYLLSS